jgi:hypothetical protein
MQWGVGHTSEPQKFLDEMHRPSGGGASELELEREAKQNQAFFSAFGMSGGSMGDGDAEKA